MPLFDPAHLASEIKKAVVMWEYGTQQLELSCLCGHKLKLLAFRSVIAWPLLNSVLVIFSCTWWSYRMEAIKKDVNVLQKMNEAFKKTKVVA